MHCCAISRLLGWRDLKGGLCTTRLFLCVFDSTNAAPSEDFQARRARRLWAESKGDSSEPIFIECKGQARARKGACLPSKMNEPIGAPPERWIVTTKKIFKRFTNTKYPVVERLPVLHLTQRQRRYITPSRQKEVGWAPQAG